MAVVLVAGMCFLAFTLLFTLCAFASNPRQWLLCLGVLATAAGIILYVPVRIALSDPSSYDPSWDGYAILGELLVVAGVVGPLHAGLFLILIGRVMEEAKIGER